MAHLAETNIHNPIIYRDLTTFNDLQNICTSLKEKDILLLLLDKDIQNLDNIKNLIGEINNKLENDNVLCLIGENEVIAEVSFALEEQLSLNYQYWISLRKDEIKNNNHLLDNETLGLAIFTKNDKKIKVNKVRLPYTYCPSCGKTTKDYGGKKHTFHEYGTLMSDVWKDIYYDEDQDYPLDIIERLNDMLATESKKMIVCKLKNGFEWRLLEKVSWVKPEIKIVKENEEKIDIDGSKLLNDDALSALSTIPSNSIDYIFVDPPYNLQKHYASYTDDMDIQEYFNWCDKWIEACIRVLKPGKYFSILNIPQWSIRHFAYLQQRMKFESWITWDALSRPGGNIMPANYVILTFKKYNLDENTENSIEHKEIDTTQDFMKPLADYYCLRESCKKKRIPVYKPLTDLWTDIHRLKHNSLRYNHPCQLPPNLMKRLIEVYSTENDYVLDCFNGVGSTTLSAHMINRKYIGIELDKNYYLDTIYRHEDVINGLDPFRKNKISAKNKTKNNDVKRVVQRKDKYKGITKKSVQLRIKNLASELGHSPSKKEALEYLTDIPEEFYDLYFKSWAEVTVSVKVGGVSEVKNEAENENKLEQLKLEL